MKSKVTRRVKRDQRTNEFLQLPIFIKCNAVSDLFCEVKLESLRFTLPLNKRFCSVDDEIKYLFDRPFNGPPKSVKGCLLEWSAWRKGLKCSVRAHDALNKSSQISTKVSNHLALRPSSADFDRFRRYSVDVVQDQCGRSN